MATHADAVERTLSGLTQLGDIPFVDFTVDLVRGVYQVILEGSMEQLKAYADFVTTVSGGLAEYQKQIAGDDPADQKELAKNYAVDVLELTAPTGTITSSTQIDISEEKWEVLLEQLGSFEAKDSSGTTKNLDSFGTPPSSYPVQPEWEYLLALITEKLKADSKGSYDLLVTILKLGMQKIVVSEGEIITKLTFSVSADDTYSKTSSNIDRKSSSWGIGGTVRGRYSGKKGMLAAQSTSGFIGGWIRGGYSSENLKVNVVNERSSAATNVRGEIIGGVEIRFRTETFPTVDPASAA